ASDMALYRCGLCSSIWATPSRICRRTSPGGWTDVLMYVSSDHAVGVQACDGVGVIAKVRQDLVGVLAPSRRGARDFCRRALQGDGLGDQRALAALPGLHGLCRTQRLHLRV